MPAELAQPALEHRVAPGGPAVLLVHAEPRPHRVDATHDRVDVDSERAPLFENVRRRTQARRPVDRRRRRRASHRSAGRPTGRRWRHPPPRDSAPRTRRAPLGGSGRRRRPRGRARPARLPASTAAAVPPPAPEPTTQTSQSTSPTSGAAGPTGLREIEIHRPGKADRVPRRARQPEVVMQHALAENLVRGALPARSHCRATHGALAPARPEAATRSAGRASPRAPTPRAAARSGVSRPRGGCARLPPRTPPARRSSTRQAVRRRPARTCLRSRRARAAGGTRAPSARQR